MSDILNNPPPALAAFLDAFGSDRTAVAHEIKEIWGKSGEFTPPQRVYNALLDARVKDGRVAAPRAQFLKEYFASSFRPEYTTLYYNKHREPLINSLASLYQEQFPERQLYRLEGDLINLGGLNRAIPDESLANRVYGTICSIVASNLHKDGKNGVIAIRKGGDELGFLFSTDAESTQETLNEAVQNAYKAVAAFIRDAGLAHVPHTKKEKPAGIGIGLGAIDLRHGTHRQQEALLQMRMENGKLAYLDTLQSSGTPTTLFHAPTKETIESAIQKHFPELDARLEGAYCDYIHGSVELTPEACRKRMMRNHTGSPVDGKINDLEQRILDHTHALTAPRDYVTNLPLFGNMQGELLPNFSWQQGTKGIRLAHIDFSNMAAGNKLSPAIGDAMGKRYGEVIQSALADITRDDLTPYLASKGGGKFAMLVPADMPDATWLAFTQALLHRLAEASHSPLDVSKEDAFAAQMAICGNPDLRQQYAEKLATLVDNGICMAWLVNPKTGLAGTQLAVALSPPLPDRKTPLGDIMRNLETETERQQQARAQQQQPNPRVRTAHAQLMGTTSPLALMSGASHP